MSVMPWITPAPVVPPSETNFRWGTVATSYPLTVRLDGDSEPLAGIPDTIIDVTRLKPGDRVWCQLYNRRVIVLGRSGTPFSSGARSGIEMLQFLMQGGGIRGVSSTGINWSQRFILMGAGTSNVHPSGYYNIDMPPDGTVIPLHGAAADSVTVASGEIPMINWYALYYELPIGVSATSVPGNFHMVYYTGGEDFQIPSSWVFICTRNGDTRAPAYKWGDGRAQDYYKTLTLQNSWVAYGSGWMAPAYKIMPDGQVKLRGLMKSGSLGNVAAATFSTDLAPEGGAAGTGVIFTQMASGGAARVDVKQDGQLQVQSIISPGTNAFVSLDGMSWFPSGS